MNLENIDLKPAKLLLRKHSFHKSAYCQKFFGLNLTIYPGVFNPARTNVSKLLANNLLKSKESFDGDILDMFCGCGALGLLLADKARTITGIDISELAIKCSQENAKKLNYSKKTKFVVGNLWKGINKPKKFDLIIANPPLLPLTPKTTMEKMIFDGPEMKSTVNFVSGCANYLKRSGMALMSFSSASERVFEDPFEYFTSIAETKGLKTNLIAKKDMGYEIYSILKIEKK
jgi:methylase of polypeptide subunit release factors